MAKKYGNESISSLKGSDRVRKRPAVIFGSDGLEGCQHSIFEILSNSIDEAREGYGNKIIITRFLDHSVEIQDFGRGCPVDFNKSENKFNWELVYCELYAGGKYKNNDGENYEYSLGLNGLGACATQYSSEYMDVEVIRDGFLYNLHFEKGENVGGLTKVATNKKQTGSKTKWKPDLDVFTDIDVPEEFFIESIKRQAVVNKGLLFVFKNQTENGFEEQEFLYEDGITDYTKELVGEDTITPIQFWEAERRGKDREDKPEYKVKLSVAVCFSSRVAVTEYYHNSSWLEHGGSPEKAVKQAFVSQIDSYLKQTNKYLKNESKISYVDIEDCLALISSSFS
ncbi:MAG: DNA topoisomerase, partial [Oscillospiraceae bacterium]